jgi:hypothetical protein
VLLGFCASSIGTMAPSTKVTVAFSRASAEMNPDAEKRGSTISVAPFKSVCPGRPGQYPQQSGGATSTIQKRSSVKWARAGNDRSRKR